MQSQKERPILFNTAMVKAVLAGTKTQTRRIVKNHSRLSQDISKVDLRKWVNDHPAYILSFCPYGKPGDILWVRERWQHHYRLVQEPITYEPNSIKDFVYKADDPPASLQLHEMWRPSIHLPKVGSRIWLRIKDVRVERLQEISEVDAKAEGIDWHIDKENGLEYFYCYSLKEKGSCRTIGGLAVLDNSYVSNQVFNIKEPAKFSYQTLWESINGYGSWKKDPWVWVVEFEVLSTNGNPNGLPF